MPIVESVEALVAGRAGVDQGLDPLLSRPPRAEGVKNSIAIPFFSQSP
jgi:hypothetical protein